MSTHLNCTRCNQPIERFDRVPGGGYRRFNLDGSVHECEVIDLEETAALRTLRKLGCVVKDGKAVGVPVSLKRVPFTVYDINQAKALLISYYPRTAALIRNADEDEQQRSNLLNDPTQWDRFEDLLEAKENYDLLL